METDDKMIVVPILTALAQEFQLKGHYLHRRASCSLAFGLYIDGLLKGVCLFGTPASPHLCRGLCGPDEAKSVIELTRLYLTDDAPKNSESFLIGRSLTFLTKDIVVSFADTARGHVGYVYQATNWLYTGLSKVRKDRVIPDHRGHSRSLGGYTSAELKKRYGDNYRWEPRSRKHRYVYFLGSHKRRKQLLKKLRYPVLPYPKFAGKVSRCDTAAQQQG